MKRQKWWKLIGISTASTALVSIVAVSAVACKQAQLPVQNKNEAVQRFLNTATYIVQRTLFPAFYKDMTPSKTERTLPWLNIKNFQSLYTLKNQKAEYQTFYTSNNVGNDNYQLLRDFFLSVITQTADETLNNAAQYLKNEYQINWQNAFVLQLPSNPGTTYQYYNPKAGQIGGVRFALNVDNQIIATVSPTLIFNLDGFLN